jgi:hypothetical protein
MRPNDQNIPEKRDSRRGGRFELFFYEQVGARYYLRFTRLALVLIICLTVIPVAAIFAIFFTQSRVDFEDVNVNVRGEPREPGNYNRIIPAPPLPTPRVSRSPRGDLSRQTPAASGSNSNASLTGSPTPSPTPPRPPS